VDVDVVVVVVVVVVGLAKNARLTEMGTFGFDGPGRVPSAQMI